MDDLISRQEALEILATMQGLCPSKAALVQNSKIWKQIKNMPSAQSEHDLKFQKIADLVEGTIDHFDLEDAMNLLYEIKEVVDER